MKIRVKFANSGTFYNLDDVGYGSVVELNDDDAEHLIRQGKAERVESVPPVERAVPPAVEEHAVAATAEPKRGPGRPRKA